ncbi:MAG: Kelch repeat-containing protein, partial [Planctomycetota bacterium]
MSEGRANAAAVLLPDGRVLVVGGDNGSGASASVEAYGLDDSFASLAPMHTARARHSASLLPDGRVLVAGGEGLGGSPTNSAEVYSPADNSAEVYSPADDSWESVASLSQARAGHSATLLSNGTVLIAGGEGAGGPLSSIEAYNFFDDSFSFAGSLSTARSDHAAAVVGSLIAGANSLVNQRVLFIGGSDGSAPLASTEAYNPANGQVSAGPALPEPRQGASATTLLRGSVYVAGGNNGSADLASALLIDAGLNVNPSAASLSSARSGHLALNLPDNNCVLLTGGGQSSADLYVPWTDEIKATSSMSAARSDAASSPVAYPGRILVAGGDGLSSAELYGFTTVRTDKEDYLPGEIVTVTGNNWAPGETVQLVFDEDPAQHEPSVYNAVADAGGNIFNQDFSPAPHDLGVRFYLTATGLSSGDMAKNTFSDAPSATIDQCRTGEAGIPSDCNTGAYNLADSASGWVNGNAGASNSHYAEGLSIGYRVRMEETPTTEDIDLFLSYEIKHGDHIAIDFLTHYQCLEPHAALGHAAETITPTDGTSHSGPADDTFSIPAPNFATAPGDAPDPDGGLDDCLREMSIWGGTLLDVDYDNPLACETGDIPASMQGSFADGVSNSSTYIRVRFRATSADVVLGWGGHIGSRNDWGFVGDVPRSAGGISGSPYHMRVEEWCFASGADAGDQITNLGNQDRSLSAAAIVTPAIKRGRKFEDKNDNGVFDGSDVYLAGWGIRIYSDDGSSNGQWDATDTLIDTATTADGSGSLPLGGYEFEVLPGDYIVCEVQQNGFSQSAPDNTVCSAGVGSEGFAPGGWAITLGDGEVDEGNDFGNVPDGSIKIIKDADPADGTDFDFDGTGDGIDADFDLDDSADSNTGAVLPDNKVFSNLGPGLRTVTESVTSGWQLTNIVCTGATSSTITIGDSGDDPGSFDSDFDSGDDRVKIDLAAGEDIECTFTNKKEGSIKFIKDADPADGTDFDFDGSGQGIDADFDLDDSAGS